VFQISAPDGAFRGWYANVELPAELNAEAHELRYVDLELDVWMHPDGEFVVLDQDEFDTLLAEHVQLADAAHHGRTELLNLAQLGRFPRWPDGAF
jgi:protein associated with RNAse G/E